MARLLAPTTGAILAGGRAAAPRPRRARPSDPPRGGGAPGTVGRGPRGGGARGAQGAGHPRPRVLTPISLPAAELAAGRGAAGPGRARKEMRPHVPAGEALSGPACSGLRPGGRAGAGRGLHPASLPAPQNGVGAGRGQWGLYRLGEVSQRARGSAWTRRESARLAEPLPPTLGPSFPRPAPGRRPGCLQTDLLVKRARRTGRRGGVLGGMETGRRGR